MAASAARQSGADAVAFHECSVTGYSFARRLSKEQMWDLAEVIPSGESTAALAGIARRHRISVLAGLFERGEDGEVYKAHVCVDEDGVKAKYRKIHPFINPHIMPGSEYVVFELKGWKCTILICYDNNVIENVRATALLGAEIIFMPHVTMCTPSTRPGAGFVDPALWKNREIDPTALIASTGDRCVNFKQRPLDFETADFVWIRYPERPSYLRFCNMNRSRAFAPC